MSEAATRAVAAMRSWSASLRAGSARLLLAVLALAFVAAPAYASSPGKAPGLVSLPTPAVDPAPKPTPLPVITPADDDEYADPAEQSAADIAAADEAAWQAYLAEARPQPKVLVLGLRAHFLGHELTGWVALSSDPAVVGGKAGWSYRWYHASLGRFISRDPAGYIDGGNLYSYVRGNPLWWTDPTGLSQSLFVQMLSQPGMSLDLDPTLANATYGGFTAGLSMAQEGERAYDLSRSQGRSIATSFFYTGAHLAGEASGYNAGGRLVTGEDTLTREEISGVEWGMSGFQVGLMLAPAAGMAARGAVNGTLGRLLLGQDLAELQRLTNRPALQSAFDLSRCPGAAKSGASDIKVIGRLEDTAVAKQWPGHDVLDIPNWNLQKNMQWMDQGIAGKQHFYVGSPTAGNMVQTSGRFAGQPTVFAMEIERLQAAGYQRIGDYFVHPEKVAGFVKP